jgi:acyl transferase domain-containing protein
VLVLEHRKVPPNLHFISANPQVPMDRLQIPTTLTPLPSNSGSVPLVALNSFGFGGSNAHALLAPAATPQPISQKAAGEVCIFPLSARAPAALAQYAQAYSRFISHDAPSDMSLGELCAASALGKSHHAVRAAVVADSLGSLQRALVSLPPSEPASAHPRIAFVFCGQGPQWWAMGRQLFEREKIVRELWEECDAICRRLGGPNLLDSLLATEAESQLMRTEIAQPALFALQAGLPKLWRAWGIEPDFVMGHSAGETAAAWTAGMFDLESILRVVIARSSRQGETRGSGRMLAAAISPEDYAEEFEGKFKGKVVVAAINAPRQITLSGDVNALE